MKDTLRKGGKASEQDSTPSETTDSTSNPWANEPALSPTKSSEAATVLSTKVVADSDSSKSAQTAPNGDDESLRAPSQPPARRRKTITKLPGTFDLEEDHLKKAPPAQPSNKPAEVNEAKEVKLKKVKTADSSTKAAGVKEEDPKKVQTVEAPGKPDEAKDETPKQTSEPATGEKIDSLRTKKKKKTVSNVSWDGMPLSPSISDQGDSIAMRTSPERKDVTSPGPSARVSVQRPVTPERKQSKNDLTSPTSASRTPTRSSSQTKKDVVSLPPTASTPSASQSPDQSRNDIASPTTSRPSSSLYFQPPTPTTPSLPPQSPSQKKNDIASSPAASRSPLSPQQPFFSPRPEVSSAPPISQSSNPAPKSSSQNKNDVVSPSEASRSPLSPQQPFFSRQPEVVSAPSVSQSSNPAPKPSSQAKKDITSPTPTARPLFTQSSTPNPFSTPQKRTKSKATTVSSSTLTPLRVFPPAAPNAFSQKVVVLTSGSSPIGASIVRHFHRLGARVIFGHPLSPPAPSSFPTTGPGSPGSPGTLTPAFVASSLIRSLGPPHCVHSQPVNPYDYRSTLGLFKLAVTMYGRVDHAIFLADDGNSKTVAEREKGWFPQFASIEDIEKNQPPSTELGLTLSAATRFAHMAIPYLRHVAKKVQNRRRTTSTDLSDTSRQEVVDRTLTFVSSVAGFTSIPGLPVHSVMQHGILGLARSLKTMVDADNDLQMGPLGAGRVRIRINTVCPGMMIPRTHGTRGGRMTVKMPDVEPEDVGRVVVGVVGNGGASTDDEDGDGPKSPYESALQEDEGWTGKEASQIEKQPMTGKVLYIIEPGLCWDVERGLGASEPAWLGHMGAERMRLSKEGLDTAGGGNQWLLDGI